MEMRKGLLAMALCMLTIGVQAQQTNQYIHKGLVRTMATLSVGHMPQFSMNNVYISGNSEYYLSNRVSWRGDASFFLNNLNGPEIFKDNHSIFSGLSFHNPTNGKIDPYLGFQPGVSFSRTMIHGVDEVTTYSKTQVSPLISGVGGINIYASQLFHVFADVRYISGTHIVQSGAESLNEVRFSFGLGFNLF